MNKGKTITIIAFILSIIVSASCQKEPSVTPGPETPSEEHEDAVTVTLRTIDRYEIGQSVCVKNAVAIASTLKFNLIWDGTTYGATSANIPIGKKATIKGKIEGLLSYVELKMIGDCEVSEIQDTELTPDGPIDITDNIFSIYARERVPSLVSFTGIAGGINKDGTVKVYIEGTPVTILYPTADFGFSALNGRKVKVTGYAFTSSANGLAVVATAAEPQEEETTTAIWDFSHNQRVNGPLWTGKAYSETDENNYIADVDKTEGDGKRYIPANTTYARLTYVQVDKTSFTETEKFPRRRLTGEGYPNCNGCMKGDYWLFDLALKDGLNPGATIKIDNLYIVGNLSCLKYWTLEILDGYTWAPLFETSTESVTSGDGAITENVTYNFVQNGDKNTPQEIEVEYTLKQSASGDLLIRLRAAANFTSNNNFYQATPLSGFCRFEGAPTISIRK